MTKYVIDLPKGVKFIVGKGYVMWSEKELLRIPVESLLPVESLQEYIAPTVAEDATVEKRVIELPADEIKLLVEHKRGRSIFGFLHYLINETGGPSLITELTDELETANTSITQDVLAEWYLGHVEFVPKKEQRFHVMTDFGTLDARDEHGETLISFETLSFLKHHGHYYEFSEAAADKLVAGLTALNARKVKVEE